MRETLPTHAVVQFDVESQLREMNEALLISSVRQHELIERTQKAEGLLRQSEEKFRAMAEAMPQKIFTANLAGGMTYLNPQWMEFTGACFEQMKDWGWMEFLHPDCFVKTSVAWRHSVETGEPFLLEHRFHGKDGDYRWHISRAVPMRNEGGQITMWVGSSTDVNDAKLADEVIRLRLEHEVDLRTADLLSINEQLQGFTYTVAHDLRQQIRGISTNASTLMLDSVEALGAEGIHRLGRLVNNAKQLSALVDDLLAYARLGKHEPTKTSLDLTSIAENVAALLTEHGALDGHAQFKIEPGLEAEGDPTMIRMVVENLLDNAYKYSKDTEWPVIEVGEVDGCFFVRDNGIGFDMEFHDKAFQPFERLEGDSKYAGTGIGLANVKRVVEKHGGRVWAESQRGKGSTFFFSLR